MFVPYNPNPKGFYTGDCVIRGLSKLLGKDWDSVYMDVVIFLHYSYTQYRSIFI